MYKGGIKVFFLFIVIIVIIVVSAGLFGYNNSGQEVKEYAQNTAQNVIETGSQKVVDRVVEEGREIVGEKLKETGEKILYQESESPGFYGEFDDGLNSQYESTVLFFTVQWCPSCVETEAHLEESKIYIPENVAIMTVDFDNAKDLREKYKVEKQHTFILINQEGEELNRWNNSEELRDILNNIK